MNVKTNIVSGELAQCLQDLQSHLVRSLEKDTGFASEGAVEPVDEEEVRLRRNLDEIEKKANSKWSSERLKALLELHSHEENKRRALWDKVNEALVKLAA